MIDLIEMNETGWDQNKKWKVNSKKQSRPVWNVGL